jgi:hypothetical protein
MELFINCAKSIKGIKKYIEAKYYEEEKRKGGRNALKSIFLSIYTI